MLCSAFAAAQDEDADAQADHQNYYIDRTGAEPRFIQRLVWEESDFVSHYIVTVEKQVGTTYIRAVREVTEENFAEISLTPGDYRYRVEVYDLFDELSYTTRWREFEVILAVQPTLTSYNPRAFYLDEDTEWEITLRGRNLIPRSEFYLVQDARRIYPISRELEDDTVRLLFSGASLIPGSYDIYVVNPGGLDSSIGKFTIANRKPFDLNIALVYAPIIPLYGYLFNEFIFNGAPQFAPFPGDYYLMAAGTKISFIPIKRTWGNLGIDLSGSAAMLEQEDESFTTNTLFINAHAGIIIQKYFFNKKFSINASIGAGLTWLKDFYYDYGEDNTSVKTTVYYPSAVGGLSFCIFVSKRIYINFGADFVQMITSPEDGEMPGFVRPFAGVGIQL